MTRVLRLSDMLFRQKGAFTRRIVHIVISIALRLFFRRIETSGVEVVPPVGPAIFVLNHPNGLIDPALVFVALPRRVSFLAKSTLFRLPVIGWLMRTVEALPVYRRLDAGEDVTQNKRTFEACRELLRQERCIALFPEGVSHNLPRLLPVKTGAARIALGALSIGGARGKAGGFSSLPIIPAGLYYTSKTSFRSEALIRCGEPFEVRGVELDQTGEPPRDAVKQLSQRIEAALRDVTLNVETDEELEVVRRTEQLFSSLYETLNIRQPLAEEFELRRRFAEEFNAPRAEDLKRRVKRYEESLREVGITPESLSVLSHSRWEVFRHFLLRSTLLVILLPLALTGALLHLPAYLLSALAARLYPTHGADDIVPTVKILAAIVLMPLTWLTVAALAYFFVGWRTALVALPVAVTCGYVAMRSIEEAYDMRGWFKAVLVLLRRRTLFLRLLLERRTLHGEILKLRMTRGDE